MSPCHLITRHPQHSPHLPCYLCMTYKKLALIPGDSLYPEHTRLNPDEHTLFFIAEDRDLCTHFKYHKHKLVLFLSAMRSHADEIRKKFPLVYFPLEEKGNPSTYTGKLGKAVKENSIEEIVSYPIEDHFFEKQIKDFCEQNNLTLSFVDSPGFIQSKNDFKDYLDSVSKPFMHTYYQRQRKKLNILMDKSGKPLHGKLSFDKENRKKLPKGVRIPDMPENTRTSHTKDVIALVDKLFPDHPGNTTNFQWATTRKDALKQLDFFLDEKFNDFGPYEDAIDKEGIFLFHSVLSPYLNTGLINPGETIEKAIQRAQDNEIHYPSLEGFIRQIIGWREFLRGMYHFVPMQKNFFGHKGKLNDSWYTANTGIDPMDALIRKVNTHAYAHHIERLMIAGNIMLLSEVHPNEVYRWFMELFIDSADWVMVPNVYGMSQFADGGSFATKPYIAGSNYIRKMSNFPGGCWTDIMDGLYWRFIDKKRDIISSNPRMSMMVKSFDRMDETRKKKILKAAEDFIAKNTS